MIQENGGNYIKGTSVHNQKIERLWRDVRTYCFDFFCALFAEMEVEQILDSENPAHIATLHYVFVPRINKALTNFTDAHNNQPCRSLHGQTPSQAFIRSHFQYQPNVPDEVPAIEREHIPVNLSVLNLTNGQNESLKQELTQVVPNPLLQVNDHGVSMFRRALDIVNNFLQHI